MRVGAATSIRPCGDALVVPVGWFVAVAPGGLATREEPNDFPDQEIAEAAILKLMEKRARERRVESGVDVIVESDADGYGKVLAFSGS